MIFDPETNEVVNNVSGGKRVWIGAHRVGPLVNPKPRNDQWTWIDGSSPLEYSNWRSGEPNNGAGGGDELCAEMNQFADSSGNWNDLPCDYDGNDHFVCQL